MKKNLLFGVIIAALVLIMVGCASNSTEPSDNGNSDNLEFMLNSDGKSYSVTGIGNCIDKDIIIPSTYENLPVTNINSWAFNCESMTSVTIGNNITSIERNAFYECDLLESVMIPSSVTSIDYEAFDSCDSLVSIQVSDSNEYYKSINGDLYSKDGKTLVQYATGKADTVFVIPDGVMNIGKAAFCDCISLTSVTIPNSVTRIDNAAFARCKSLTSIVIPNGITSIGNEVFYRCTSLTNITIPDSVVSIAKHALYECTSMININFAGTKAQWNAVEKADYWNSKTGNYTVYCTDGNITK